MIDFNNADFFKLKQVDNSTYESLISVTFADDETILSTYKGVRDGVVFTNKRIIAVNVQGLTGKKRILLHYRIAKFKHFR